MTHRSDTPKVFWSREDWLAEIIQLEGRLVEAGTGTDAARFWRERLKQARTDLRSIDG